MKKNKLFYAFMLIIAVMFLINFKTEAATVKAKYSKGTLVIYGKGKMGSEMTFKNNKRIKKVIIKNNVTSISNSAFANCKNLNKVVIGKRVKRIGSRAFLNCKKLRYVKIGKKVETVGLYAFSRTNIKKIVYPKSVKVLYAPGISSKSLTEITMPGNVIFKNPFDDQPKCFSINLKKVKFSTDLDLCTVSSIFTENYVVSAKDNKYKSVDGIIYSKDKKKVVRLPEREKIEIVDGCEEFRMDSLLFGLLTWDDYYIDHCSCVKEIILPESVNKITFEDDNFYTSMYRYTDERQLERVTIKNKDIDQKYIDFFIEKYSKSEARNYKIEKETSEEGYIVLNISFEKK